jgi:hypothetical protein
MPRGRPYHRRYMRRLIGSWWPERILLAAVAIIMLGGLSGAFGGRVIQCDGSVPAWMITDDYAGSGCVELKPAWQGWLPGTDHTPVCLGLCLESSLAPAP